MQEAAIADPKVSALVGGIDPMGQGWPGALPTVTAVMSSLLAATREGREREEQEECNIPFN